METQHLIHALEREANLLDAALRHHAPLRPLFSREFAGVDIEALRQTYLQMLRFAFDYVQYTVPALRAAGLILANGDDEDRRWSRLFLEYAVGETDGDYEHQIWARDDMKALGAPRELLDAPTNASAVLYGKYFVDDAALHPYAILGAKGVLEQLSIRFADDVVRGVVASGIANAEHATTFFAHHGVIDIDHVRDGVRHLASLGESDKRFQVLGGAYFTSCTYRALLHDMVVA